MANERMPVINAGEFYKPLNAGYELIRDKDYPGIESKPVFVNPIGFVNLYCDFNNEDPQERNDVYILVNGYMVKSEYESLVGKGYFDLDLFIYPPDDQSHNYEVTARIPETALDTKSNMKAERENPVGSIYIMEGNKPIYICLNTDELKALEWKIDFAADRGGEVN